MPDAPPTRSRRASFQSARDQNERRSTAHTRGRRRQEAPGRAQIQRPPAPLPTAPIEAPGPLAADATAESPPPVRANPDHQVLALELHTPHDRACDPEQTRPYSGPAHAASITNPCRCTTNGIVPRGGVCIHSHANQGSVGPSQLVRPPVAAGSVADAPFDQQRWSRLRPHVPPLRREGPGEAADSPATHHAPPGAPRDGTRAGWRMGTTTASTLLVELIRKPSAQFQFGLATKGAGDPLFRARKETDVPCSKRAITNQHGPHVRLHPPKSKASGLPGL
jgi:hypothetical protein